MRILVVIAVIVVSMLLIANNVDAYGPYQHYLDAWNYVASCESDPIEGPRGNADILNQYPEYLNAGTSWPDVARYLPDALIDSHNREFVNYILESAEQEYLADPTNPDLQKKLAWAVGIMIHAAGDIAAQNIVVPYYMSLLVEAAILSNTRWDNHAGGYAEGIIEAINDVRQASASFYLDLLADYLGQDRLSEMLGWYNQYEAEYCGKSGQEPNLAERYSYVFNRVIMISQGRIIGQEYQLDTDQTAVIVNWDEVYRIIFDLHIFNNQLFWSEFDDHFTNLGWQIMRRIHPGENWYDWPNWSATAMCGGAMQGMVNLLGEYLPNYQGYADLLVYNSGFNDRYGNPIDQINRLDPPAIVWGWVELSSLYIDPVNVVFNVYLDGAGVDPIACHQEMAIEEDPFDGSKIKLECSFDPSEFNGIKARGFYPVLLVNGKIIFTGNLHDIFEYVDQIDLSVPAYDKYCTYDCSQSRAIPFIAE